MTCAARGSQASQIHSTAVEWYPKIGSHSSFAPGAGAATKFCHRNIALRAGLPSIRVGYKTKILAGGIDMTVTWDPNLDPKIADLIDVAFEKSWQFVRTDPELAHRDLREMRARLTESLRRLAQSGERDVWRLANGAIGQLRRQRSAA